VQRRKQDFELGIAKNAGHRGLPSSCPVPLNHGAPPSQGADAARLEPWRVRANNWRDKVLAPGALGRHLSANQWEGPMSAKLRHVAINADDVQRARRFYEAVFGWRFEPWGPPNFY
jgi:hypothetical protein